MRNLRWNFCQSSNNILLTVNIFSHMINCYFFAAAGVDADEGDSIAGEEVVVADTTTDACVEPGEELTAERAAEKMIERRLQVCFISVLYHSRAAEIDN